MPIAFRAGTVFNNAGGGTTITATFPAGTTAGDVLVLHIGSRNTANITTPSGWTILEPGGTISGIAAFLYWKVATGSEGASQVITIPSGKAVGSIHAISGADSTLPVDAQAIGTGSSAQQTYNFSALGTYTSMDGMYLAFASCDNGENDIQGPQTPLSVFLTKVGNSQNTGGGAGSRASVVSYYSARHTANTGGTLQSGFWTNSRNSISHAVFLKEAVTGPIASTLKGALLVAGLVATVSVTQNVTIGTQPGQALLDGKVSTVATPKLITTEVGSLSVTGQAPSVTAAYIATAGTGQIATTGLAPSIYVGAPTRMYFPADTPAAVSPSFGGPWNNTADAVRRRLASTKGSSPITIGNTINLVTGQLALDRQYVSDRMAAGIYFSSRHSVKAYVMTREYDDLDNVNIRYVLVRIFSQDGLTLRADFGITNGSIDEAINNATHRNSGASGSLGTVDYTTVAGDRLVIEWGYSDAFNPGVTPQASAKWGENANDLPENLTQTTDGAGWVELGTTVTFLDKVIETGKGLVAVTGLIPTVAISNNISVVSQLGSVSLVGISSQIALAINAGLGQLNINGLVPTAVATANIRIDAGLGALSLSGLVPQTNQGIVSGIGTLAINGLVPNANATNHLFILCGTGALNLSGLAPQNNNGINTALGQLNINGFVPTSVSSNNQRIDVGLGVLLLNGQAPQSNNRVNLATGALQVTGIAPSVVKITTTQLGILSLNGFTPSISVSNNQRVDAGLGSTILTGRAPVIDNKINGATGALLLSGFAPNISVSDNKIASAGVGSLSLSGFNPLPWIAIQTNSQTGLLILNGLAPVVAISNNQVVVSSVGTLNLIGQVPVLNQKVNLSTGALAINGIAPVVIVSDNKSIATSVGSIILVGQVPQVNLKTIPAVGSVALTGFPPNAVASNHQIVVPTTGSILLDGMFPTVQQGNNIVINTGVSQIALTGYNPSTSAPVLVPAGRGQVVMVGLAPVIATTDHKVFITGLGQAIVSGFTPTVVATDNKVATPETGLIVASGSAPSANGSSNTNIPTVTGVLVGHGFASAVIATDHKIVVTGVGSLSIIGHAPVTAGVNIQVDTGVGGIVIVGHTPIGGTPPVDYLFADSLITKYYESVSNIVTSLEDDSIITKTVFYDSRII